MSVFGFGSVEMDFSSMNIEGDDRYNFSLFNPIKLKLNFWVFQGFSVKIRTV